MELNPRDRAISLEIDREHVEELKQEERIVEALLYAMGRAVSLPEIASALNADTVLAKDAAERLLQIYEERQGGILIRRVEESYQMCTNPNCFEGLIRVVSHPVKPVLSDVTMETLAIIAYKQPVTKAEIERVRGVQSDHAVNRLVEYGLVMESGRLNAPGRPALFVTTEEFLRRFGMESLSELPALSADMAAEIEAQVAEEVSDVLGTDPAELAQEIHEQRAVLSQENVVVPEKTETAKVKAAAPKKPAVMPKAAASEKTGATQSIAEAAAAGAARAIGEMTGTATGESQPLIKVEMPEAVSETAVETIENASEEKRVSASEVAAEDDEALEQMIYEAAMGEEPIGEQHYSFIEEDTEAQEEAAEEAEAAESESEETGFPQMPSEPEMTEDVEEPDIESENAPEEDVDADADKPMSDGNLSEEPDEGVEVTDARGTGGHQRKSIFDSVQLLSEAELAEIEEEERLFTESLRGLPMRRQTEIEAASETEKEEADPAQLPTDVKSENTEAANAGGPES